MYVSRDWKERYYPETLTVRVVNFTSRLHAMTMEFKICRVCLDRTATIPVFNKQDDVQYCAKIMKCVNVVIAEGDGFPDAICEGCAGDLAVSYEFATRCEASDKALRCLDLLQTAEPEPELKSSPEPIKHEVNPEYNMACVQIEDVYNSFLDTEPLSEYHYRNEFKNERPEIYSNGNNFGKYKTKYSKKLLPEHLRSRKLRLKTGPIQCIICDRILSCHSAFELHMRTHTKERPYSCDICKKTFSNKYTLKTHIQRHYGITDYKKSNTGNDSDRRKNRPKMGPFQCATCGRMVSSHSAMENHMRTHTGEKPFACELCGAKYRLKGTLKRHMHCSHPDTHANTKYTCEHCGKIFLAKSSIITHLRVHTGDKPYLCPYCPQSFRQISSLIRHKRRHTGERPYTCDICGRSFLDKSLLNKHQSVHSVERKFGCHICTKTFKSKGSLKVHTDSHSKTKLWICSFCGMTFTFKGNLKTHIGRKHSEKSGMCLVCNKEFGDVEAHMRVHTGEKPFTCKICDQSYGTVRSLSHHMGFKHRDAGKFKCALEDCPKSFPTAAMLEFHVLKHHTQTTPYVCPHCARGFLRPCDLSRHLKLNHMDTQTQVKSQFLKAIIKDS